MFTTLGAILGILSFNISVFLLGVYIKNHRTKEFLLIRNKRKKGGLSDRQVLHMTYDKHEALSFLNAFRKYDSLHSDEYVVIRENGKAKRRKELI